MFAVVCVCVCTSSNSVCVCVCLSHHYLRSVLFMNARDDHTPTALREGQALSPRRRRAKVERAIGLITIWMAMTMLVASCDRVLSLSLSVVFEVFSVLLYALSSPATAGRLLSASCANPLDSMHNLIV